MCGVRRSVRSSARSASLSTATRLAGALAPPCRTLSVLQPAATCALVTTCVVGETAKPVPVRIVCAVAGGPGMAYARAANATRGAKGGVQLVSSQAARRRSCPGIHICILPRLWHQESRRGTVTSHPPRHPVPARLGQRRRACAARARLVGRAILTPSRHRPGQQRCRCASGLSPRRSRLWPRLTATPLKCRAQRAAARSCASPLR